MLNSSVLKCFLVIVFEEWTGEHAHKLTMLVRAINYNLGKQMFTVVFISSLEGIIAISEAVKMDGDVVQSGVVGIVVSTICMSVYPFIHPSIHSSIHPFIYMYMT